MMICQWLINAKISFTGNGIIKYYHLETGKLFLLDYLELIKDFPQLWYNPRTPQREKKRILRLMIKDVTLIKDVKITLKIRWQGGAHTLMEIPKPLPAPLKRSTSKDAID